MPSISRTNDLWTGICCCHDDPKCIGMGGYIITGSGNHTSAALAVGRFTDMTVGYCGHTGTIITGSPANTTNNLSKGRVGSTVVGCNLGTVVTGNPNHTVP